MYNRTVVLGDGYVSEAYRKEGWDHISSEKFRYDGSNFHHLERLLMNCTTVINCIAKTDTTWTEVPENFKELWRTNVEFVQRLSANCQLYGQKLVHISTTDLYGNSHDEERNDETRKDLDIGTDYRFSKCVSERVCHPDDLILRIRLPFDDNLHPKNLLVKIPKFNKFYHLATDMTFLPDLVNATKILVREDQSGTFNIVSDTATSILHIAQSVQELPILQGINPRSENDMVIKEVDNKNVFNVCSTSKLNAFYTPSDLHASLIKSYAILLQKGLNVV